MSIKKSQAILKHFIDLKFIVSGLRCDQKTKPCFLFRELSSGRLPVKINIVETLNDRRSTRLESLRTFLDKSGKGIEEKGKRKEEAEKSCKCPRGGG